MNNTSKTKLYLIVFLIILGYTKLSGQTNNCLNDFDYLIKKIKDDYPGYHDKVTDKNKAQLIELEKSIRQKINYYPDSCGYYLSEYTQFFKDNHLYVRRIYSQPSNSNVQLERMEVSTYGKNILINTDSLMQITSGIKSIEGVWEGFNQTFAIIKDGQKYVGVTVIASNWKAGQVMYEFQFTNDTVFEITNYSLFKDRKSYTTQASLHLDGKIIEFHDNTRFVRKSNSDIWDKATLNSYRAEHPNGLNTYPIALYLNDSTYYMRIPGFRDNTANEFVIKHWNEITTRPNLIIDIRNNGGGQDNYYEELATIMYSKPYDAVGVEWYATKGNIKLFESWMKNGELKNGEEGIRWTKALLEAMKKNIGGFVTHPDAANYNPLVKEDTVYPMPRNIGIIINERNGSSAEQFLLAAKQSDKVILFGNSNTAGVLDYSNVTPSPLPSNKYELWNPMTRSKRLPKNPIDIIGIAPDVKIPFPATEQLYDRLDNWVYFVENYLDILNEIKYK